jgi:hypothetical protein
MPCGRLDIDFVRILTMLFMKTTRSAKSNMMSCWLLQPGGCQPESENNQINPQDFWIRLDRIQEINLKKADLRAKENQLKKWAKASVRTGTMKWTP